MLQLADNGEILTHLLVGGKFSENLARHYFDQLLRGINSCHLKGFAHRDLKLENLLLDRNY